MDKIEKYIINLKSPDTNTRIFACNMLRGRFSLPESAITALETATTDPDPQVADAARLALAIHKPESWKIGLPASQNEEPSLSTPSFFWLCFLISLVFSIVTALGLFYFGLPTPFNKSWYPIYGSSGCCGVEFLLLFVTTILCFVVIVPVRWFFAYYPAKRLNLNTASSIHGMALFVGFLLGILVGVVVHFLPIG